MRILVILPNPRSLQRCVLYDSRGTALDTMISINAGVATTDTAAMEKLDIERLESLGRDSSLE